MLAERLSKAWRARQASVPIEPAMRFAPEGLVLGAQTVLAPVEAGGIRLDGGEARLSALLAAAHMRPVDARALNHIQKAAQRWREGQAGLAQVHLALSGLGQLVDPHGAAQRLFLADGLMAEGIEPEAVLRALGLDPSATLGKDYLTQPRVPKGSGRPSGQWTNEGGGDDGAPSAGPAGDPSSAQSDEHPWGGLSAEAAASLRANLVPARYDARAPGTGKPAPVAPDLLQTAPKFVAPAAARPWFIGLSAAQLGELALFAARFGGPAAALGILFIPSNKSLHQEGTIPGWPAIHYQWRSDERALAFSYLGSDLRQFATTAELGSDGLFRDVEGQVIGRALPDGSVIIDRSAILPKESRGEDEPTLCPKPVPDKDHGNLNGLLYENYMKALVNPGNPTPSGYGIKKLNPATGKPVMLDDCQRRSGILFDYKGPTYSWLLSTSIAPFVVLKMVSQANRQLAASKGYHIVWVFEEKDAMDFVKSVFERIPTLRGKIQFDYEPMPGFSI